ncbi:MAG: HAMP domain-containing sensor histidine kinase [Sedimenticola sp.]
MLIPRKISIYRWVASNLLVAALLGALFYVLAPEDESIAGGELTFLIVIAFLTTSFILYFSRETFIALKSKSYAQKLNDIFDKHGRSSTIPAQPDLLFSAIAFSIEQLINESDHLSLSLTKRENEFWSILDTQTELVFIMGEDGYIIYKNRAFDEFFGNPIFRLFDNEPDLFSINISKLMETLTPFVERTKDTDREIECLTELPIDNKSRYISWTIKRQPDADNEQFLVVGRDETANILAREENERLEKIATIGRAASTIFHEVNQPISVIQLSSTLIQDTCSYLNSTLVDNKDIEEISQNTEIILNQVNRINEIIRNLRLFYSGSYNKIETEIFQPYIVLNEVIDNLNIQFLMNNIALNYSIDDKSIVIDANPVLFGQVIQNILQNSIHALANQETGREKRISISMESFNSLMIIVIEDNGTGIPDEIIDRVLEPFFTTKPLDTGSGLGLALCLNVINKMEGELLLENLVGGGLKTTIKIPTE